MENNKACFDEQLQELVRQSLPDFHNWTSFISKVDEVYHDNLEAICSAYDSFLLEFPLCHEYWKKYAAHKARLCSFDELVDIYERAVHSLSYCVGIWVEYCSFGILAYEDPSDVRRLFKRALSFVGKDYLCHPLWDKYFEFEFSQQQWTCLTQIYVQALKFPTKKLHHYFDNFIKFVEILKEEIEQHSGSEDIEMEYLLDGEVTTSKDEISSLVDNLLLPSTGYFRKYISLGERYHRNASELEKEIYCFESKIQRINFDATPVEDDQLENWRQYLDFVEKQGDFDWAVKLYERCLIPCSGYPEFWMRYVDYVETKGGRELAKFALDRARKIFVKNSPKIHFFSAQFQELNDKTVPHTKLSWADNESDSHFVEKVVRKANRERRSGNFVAASGVYDKALEMATERQKLHTVSILYVHFARLKYLMTGRKDQARDVIIKGLQHLPHCKTLLEGLINFLMAHGDGEQIDLVDDIVADAISLRSDASQALSNDDREDISVLFIQFVDLCGNIHDIRKAWSRHIKLFPNLIKPSFSDKLHKSKNQLAMERQVLSLPENHASQTGESVSTTDHGQPEADNGTAKETLLKLSPEKCPEKEKHTSQLDQINQYPVHESAPNLVCEVADAAKKGKNCLSLVDLSLDDQEMECGDFISPENCSNANVSPSIARQGSFQEAIPKQTQNEEVNHLSSANEVDFVPRPTERNTHIPTDQGGTLANPSATYYQDLQQHTVHFLQSQPSETRSQGNPTTIYPQGLQQQNTVQAVEPQPSITHSHVNLTATYSQDLQKHSVHVLQSQPSETRSQGNPTTIYPQGLQQQNTVQAVQPQPSITHSQGNLTATYSQDLQQHTVHVLQLQPSEARTQGNPTTIYPQGLQQQNTVQAVQPQPRITHSQGNPTATYSQDLQQQNPVHILQSQPSNVPSFHPQAQMPQLQMQIGGDLGYNQVGYHCLRQQLMVQEQWMQQQARRQPNMLQPNDQHGYYVQQQQQLAQMYYQYPQQNMPQPNDHHRYYVQQQQQLYQQFYQGQQVMTQKNPGSSGAAESPQPPV